MANWRRFKLISGFAYGLALIGLYYWLRYRTTLWNQHRWIGFIFGLIVMLGLLNSLRQDSNDEYLSRRSHLLLGILSLVIGTISIGTFVLGGTGSDAFTGLTFIGFGIRSAYVYRRAGMQISKNAVREILSN